MQPTELSRIAFFNFPSKHSSWWRRTEGVFSVTFFCLPRRLEDVLQTRLEDVLKTFKEDVLQIRLEDVLEDKKYYAEDVLKTSWKTKNVCWVVTFAVLKILDNLVSMEYFFNGNSCWHKQNFVSYPTLSYRYFNFFLKI